MADTVFLTQLKLWHVMCAGEDLLLASADKPFRFPATFTFVVRSFTVLDGIGKGLDPRFDISEIAAPYARNLLLEAQPQFAKLQADLGKRLALQVHGTPMLDTLFQTAGLSLVESFFGVAESLAGMLCFRL